MKTVSLPAAITTEHSHITDNNKTQLVLQVIRTQTHLITSYTNKYSNKSKLKILKFANCAGTVRTTGR